MLLPGPEFSEDCAASESDYVEGYTIDFFLTQSHLEMEEPNSSSKPSVKCSLVPFEFQVCEDAGSSRLQESRAEKEAV